jgi:hypothetical protein
MDPIQRESLSDLLCGYFGEFGFDECCDELASVTDGDPEQQRAYLALLDAGITCAAQGDEEMPALVRHALGGGPFDVPTAKTILEEIRAAYVAAIARLEGPHFRRLPP